MAPRPETARPLLPGPGIDPEQHLAALGIEVLHLAVPDTSGTLRQKRFRLPRAAGLIRDGWSFIDAVQWWDSADGTPGGARALGYHQDSSYELWADPPDWVSCWIALIEQFHAPDNYHKELHEAPREAGVSELNIVKIVVPRGGGVFHQGWIWHGSGVNHSDRPRRSLVAHCMPAGTRFHPTITGAIYGRYKRFGDLTMDESFFPVTWHQSGHRSAFIDGYLSAQAAERPAGDGQRGRL